MSFKKVGLTRSFILLILIFWKHILVRNQAVGLSPSVRLSVFGHTVVGICSVGGWICGWVGTLDLWVGRDVGSVDGSGRWICG